ncbi:hypothetical protein NEMBOFW57_000209 [Staphylotrichum longicolle]|uniref:Uncharacterized protein n=1 Tax=Staphylotrichum longicolle TaxID=669026 RepID=A0AAD4EZC0_9PEZI|nr:hypothetical protein NEMBOFW57_000209 [Staphylotrichum longicolle]
MAVTTSRSLLGFRDIPPGAHFLWVQQLSGVSRCGYWFVTTRQGTARIKQWDGYNEVLGKPGSPPRARNQEDNIEAVYPVLQPYTLYTHKDNAAKSLGGTHPAWARSPASLWQALTSAISTESLARITGEQDVQEYLVDSMDCPKDARHSASPTSTTKFDADPINNKLTFLFSQDMRDLQILDLQPSSARNADTSARVLALLTTTADQAILADLQFTFLTGTHLGNPACLEQWWNLVLKIVLRAYTLALTRPQLARDLLRTLHAQLFNFLPSATSSNNTK